MTRLDPTLASLCLAALDGDSAAHLILADRLEEMGSGKAESLRNRQSHLTIHGQRFDHKLSDPFRLVLHCLPADACWALLCDFAEHVLPYFEQEHPGETAPRRAIDTRRQWLEGACTDAEIESARAAAWQAGATGDYPRNNSGLDPAKAARCSGDGDARAAALFAARYARMARSQAVVTGIERREAVDDEVCFQLDRVKEYLRSHLS